VVRLVKKEAGEAVTAAKREGADLVKEATTRRETAEAGEKAAMGTLQREIKEFNVRKETATKLDADFMKAAGKLAEDTVSLSEKLAKDAAVKFADNPDFFRTPQGLHMLLGMSNIQIQMTLGLIDLAEFAAGVGGRRYLVFAARHGFVYLMAKNPELFGQLGKYGAKGLSIVNKAVNGNPLAPNYLANARRAFVLAEQATIERAREKKRNAEHQAGTANPQGH